MLRCARPGPVQLATHDLGCASHIRARLSRAVNDLTAHLQRIRLMLCKWTGAAHCVRPLCVVCARRADSATHLCAATAGHTTAQSSIVCNFRSLSAPKVAVARFVCSVTPATGWWTRRALRLDALAERHSELESTFVRSPKGLIGQSRRQRLCLRKSNQTWCCPSSSSQELDPHVASLLQGHLSPLAVQRSAPANGPSSHHQHCLAR